MMDFNENPLLGQLLDFIYSQNLKSLGLATSIVLLFDHFSQFRCWMMQQIVNLEVLMVLQWQRLAFFCGIFIMLKHTTCFSFNNLNYFLVALGKVYII